MVKPMARPKANTPPPQIAMGKTEDKGWGVALVQSWLFLCFDSSFDKWSLGGGRCADVAHGGMSGFSKMLGKEMPLLINMWLRTAG